MKSRGGNFLFLGIKFGISHSPVGCDRFWISPIHFVADYFYIYIWDHIYIWLVDGNLFYRGCGEIGVSDCMCVRLRVCCV